MRTLLRGISLSIALGLAQGAVVADEPRVWSGPDHGFAKEDHADWKDPANQDRITDGVRLTRADREGLFNAARDLGFRPDSPAGTEWAYGRAADWATLEFRGWRDWHGGNPLTAIGREAVIHLVEKDAYLDVTVLSWTDHADGGGFSYERASEAVPGEKVWTGPAITFTKADDADIGLAANQDRIADGVWITRKDRRGLFNVAREVGYEAGFAYATPPTGTEWAWGTTADLPHLVFSTWRHWNGGDPRSMVGKSAVLHLLEEDVYLDIRFLSWTGQDAGGGYSYERATEGVPGERVWTGPMATFTKEDYAEWWEEEHHDRITDGVRLARGDDAGLFNLARESHWYYDPDRPSPPYGTEWAYGQASDWPNLRFTSWTEWHGRCPPSAIGRAAVLHLVREDVYLDIVFTEWTEDADGGGFSYQRATEGIAGEKVWTGPTVTFTKADGADPRLPANQDRISPEVRLTRANLQGLYNALYEAGYGYGFRSPVLTEWAFGTAADWQSLTFRSWSDWTPYPTWLIVERDAVLHLVKEDVYLDIRFLSWSADASGGGFSYERATEGVPGEKVWTGARKTFAKEDYGDFGAADQQDRITGSVWLTRRDDRGIFNIAREPHYGFYPDQQVPLSPEGTEWAWGSASEWASLDFHPWYSWMGGNYAGGPPSTVGRSAVLHLIEADAYLDVRFLRWTEDAQGGGFSYVRASEAVPGQKVWSGPPVYFAKADGADWADPFNQDRIADGVRITRRHQEGLFNAALEFRYGEDEEPTPTPPTGTEWAFGAASDWRDLRFRPWADWHDWDPPSVLGRPAVLHLIEEDVYLDIRFTSWTESAEGGGFSYLRASNKAPSILIGPAPVVAVVPHGGAAEFSVEAVDPNGDPLTYLWDFGDGSTGTGTNPAHAYAEPGEFVVTVTVDDGLLRTTGVTAVTMGAAMTVDAVKGKVDFRTPGRDGLTTRGTLALPASFVPAGRVLRFQACGVDESFTLDSKGRGTTYDGDGRVALKYDRRKGLWKFRLTLTNDDYAAAWAEDGMIDADIMVPVEWTSTVTVGGMSFTLTDTCTWRARQGRSGLLK
jgi:hypothetical protein